MKKAIGTLLWLAGHIINGLTLFSALIYLFGAVVWMHAPLVGVLLAGAPMLLPPLALAWLCRRIGRRLRDDLPVLPASRQKRWLLGGLAVATAGVFAMLARTGVNEYKCSIDRSRNAATHAAETQKNGFELVCESALAQYDVGLLPNLIATRNLAFTPVDLSHTPFAQFESLGSRAETVVDVRSRLYRGFRMPDGHRLILFEQDMSADGSTSWRDPKDEPERVNGHPARLVVMEDPTGKAVSLLSWMEGRRDYQLWVDANIARVPLRQQLFALAASIPKAVPACPNEPPPRSARLGPDGQPVKEPMPQVLTQAQLDTLGDKSKRPCK
ncbi:hypothetical protein [Massilia sp. Bi118]|uniref:hypothetical protein n=1 Tax=Massilia sp. Bi118 TaxID=2822346 RepID=UPI001E55EF4D|nr:hypothetical protein [Massilia sp. Bi118]